MTAPVRLRSRGQTAGVLTGIVAGMLVAGLLVPLAFGKPVAKAGTKVAAGGPTFAAGSQSSAGPTDTSSAGGSGGETTTTIASGPAAATSGGGGSSPSGGAAPATAAGDAVKQAAQSLTASDVGVTPDSIKVGFMILDLGNTGRQGVNTTGVDPKQQQAMLQAYVDDLNARGGVNGRKIAPFYRVFDALSPDDLRAACLEMTEDKKVFAIVSMPGYGDTAALCVTAEHHTPLVNTGDGISQEYFDKSGGLLITQMEAGERFMQNYVDQLTQLNLLAGHKIGILTDQREVYTQVVDNGLIPALQKGGYTIAHVSRLSSDQSTSPSQVPIEVANMRRDGVDTVIFVTNFLNSTPFVQAAGGQAWNPRWLSSDWGSASDFENQGMPPNYDGALVMTGKRYDEPRAGLPENPTDAHCREIYEKSTGQTLTHDSGANANYNTLVIGCGLMQIFEAAAKAAGPNLTRTGFASAAANLGQMNIGFTLPGQFRPNKTDFVDSFRWLKFSSQCTCLNIADPTIRKAKFS
jgi:ABC-type branched-subunit amino acid transport system substrate-binding protein